jgi:hypothetical protein
MQRRIPPIHEDLVVGFWILAPTAVIISLAYFHDSGNASGFWVVAGIACLAVGYGTWILRWVLHGIAEWVKTRFSGAVRVGLRGRHRTAVLAGLSLIAVLVWVQWQSVTFRGPASSLSYNCLFPKSKATTEADVMLLIQATKPVLSELNFIDKAEIERRLETALKQSRFKEYEMRLVSAKCSLR